MDSSCSRWLKAKSRPPFTGPVPRTACFGRNGLNVEQGRSSEHWSDVYDCTEAGEEKASPICLENAGPLVGILVNKDFHLLLRMH